MSDKRQQKEQQHDYNVKWRSFYDDYSQEHGCSPAVDWQETLLGDWINYEGNAEKAVGKCIEDYIKHEGWDEHFGEDDNGFFYVEVAYPASIAGGYWVDLKKVVKANAQCRKAKAL